MLCYKLHHFKVISENLKNKNQNVCCFGPFQKLYINIAKRHMKFAINLNVML